MVIGIPREGQYDPMLFVLREEVKRTKERSKVQSVRYGKFDQLGFPLSNRRM